MRRRVSQSGIPELFRGAGVTSREVASWVRDVERDRASAPNLVVQGAAGTGKTREACAALLELAPYMPVWFCRFGDVLRAIRATYGADGSEEDVMARWRGCSVLLIDDLGKERPTPDAMEKLYALTDGRYANARPTVITTQYAYAGLRRRFTESGADAETADAVLRRIYQGATVVTMR